MRKIVSSIFAVLLFAGIFSATQSVASAQCAASNNKEEVSLPILMYHHLHRDPERWGDYTISEETLEGDLQYLKERGYETITVKQLLEYVCGEGTLPEKPVMLTFDDGQESFTAYALPLLEKYGMSAVVAVVGSFAEMDAETVHNVSYSYLNWRQLAELSKNPLVELQSHTYNMHNLAPRRGCTIMNVESFEDYRKAFTCDLKNNEQLFIEHIGAKPISFAYPYGSECTEAREILKSLGYKVLFTCRDNVNTISRNPDCLLELGRYNRPNGMSRDEVFSVFPD